MTAHMNKCMLLCPFFQLSQKSCSIKPLKFSRLIIRSGGLKVVDGFKSYTCLVPAANSLFKKFLAPAAAGFNIRLRSHSGERIFNLQNGRHNENFKDNVYHHKYGVKCETSLSSLLGLVACVLLGVGIVSSEAVNAADHLEDEVSDSVRAGKFEVNCENVFKHSYTMASPHMDQINDFAFEDEQTTVSIFLAFFHNRKLNSLVLEDHLEGLVLIDGFECEPQERGGRFLLHPSSFVTFSPGWLAILQKRSGAALAESAALVKLTWSFKMQLTKMYKTELEERLKRLEEAAKELYLRPSWPLDAAASFGGEVVALKRAKEEQEYRQKEAFLLGRLERVNPILEKLTEGLDSLREGCSRLGAWEAEQLVGEEIERLKDENDALERDIVFIKERILKAKLVLRQCVLTPAEELSSQEDSASWGNEALVGPSIFLNFLRSLLIKKESRPKIIEETIIEETEEMKAQKALRETYVVHDTKDGLQEMLGPEFGPKADASEGNKEKGSPLRPKEKKTSVNRNIFRRS